MIDEFDPMILQGTLVKAGTLLLLRDDQTRKMVSLWQHLLHFEGQHVVLVIVPTTEGGT